MPGLMALRCDAIYDFSALVLLRGAVGWLCVVVYPGSRTLSCSATNPEQLTTLTLPGGKAMEKRHPLTVNE